MTVGCAIAQAVSFGFRTWRPGFDPRSGFVANKVALGRFLPSTSVSPASSQFTECSILFYRSALVQEATCSQRSKWTQSQPTPRIIKKKNRRRYSEEISKRIASSSKPDAAVDHWNTGITIRIPHGAFVFSICGDRCR
jgi:hypothetical protein